MEIQVKAKRNTADSGMVQVEVINQGSSMQIKLSEKEVEWLVQQLRNAVVDCKEGIFED